MKKEDLIALGLDEELAQKVADASAEELKGFIPKQRFDDVNEAKKQLEQDIKDRDTQLEDLKTKAAGNEELTAKINELTQQNQQVAQDYQAKLEKQSFDFALQNALSGAKAKNAKAVEALLNKENIKLDGDKLLGLDDQLKTIQESDPYLFEAAQQQTEPPKPTFSTGQHQTSGNLDAFASALLAK